MGPNASKSLHSADLSNIFPLVKKEILPFPAIQLIFVIEVKGNPKRFFKGVFCRLRHEAPVTEVGPFGGAHGLPGGLAMHGFLIGVPQGGDKYSTGP